jgi:hypothetical protein
VAIRRARRPGVVIEEPAEPLRTPPAPPAPPPAPTPT